VTRGRFGEELVAARRTRHALPQPLHADGERTAFLAESADSLLHSELMTQRNRALSYVVVAGAMLLTKAAGIFGVHLNWGLGIFGVGILTVAWCSLVAMRARRTTQRANLAVWWIASDTILVTAMVCATGGLSSPWFVLYLGCAGAAITHLRLLPAIWFGIAAGLLYLGALAAMGQVGLLDNGFFEATCQLALLFCGSLFLLANTRKLLSSTQLNQRLKSEADERVMELTRLTRDLEVTSALLRKFAELDALTGAYNRRYLLERIAQEEEQYRASVPNRRAADLRSGTGVIMIDLDRFKRINDAYGHAAGDEALKHLAGIIRQCMRSEDTLVRWGGDEFLILLPRISSMQLSDVSERIRTAVCTRACRLTTLGGEKLSCMLSCSIGWSLFDWQPRHDGASPWEWALAAADAAAYSAKRAGGNRSYPPKSAIVEADEPTEVPMPLAVA
jgi:diguanylate cyclase (GGDEF)-like protein